MISLSNNANGNKETGSLPAHQRRDSPLSRQGIRVRDNFDRRSRGPNRGRGRSTSVLKNERPDGHSEKEWTTILNMTRDWLKHATAQSGETREITQFEAMIMIIRAVYKFTARYNEATRDMEHFYEWCRREGYTDQQSFVA